MKNTVYVYGESSLLKIVTEILFDYKIVPFSFDQINNENFKNNNIILFGNKDLEEKVKKNFFLHNNAIFFIKNNKVRIEESKFKNVNFFLW